jgi:hypothetical protein
MEADITDIRGYILQVARNNGKTWNYHVKDEITEAILSLLRERQKQNWPTLAIGIFEPIDNGKILHLNTVML